MDRSTRDSMAICDYDDFDQLWSGDHNTKKNVERFKAICNECPVKEWCRQDAYIHEAYGNFGGTTRKERLEFRKTGQFLSLLYQAAKEGWLIPSQAQATYEDIQDALWAAQLPERNQLKSLDYDFELAPFPEFPALADLLQPDLLGAALDQQEIDGKTSLERQPQMVSSSAEVHIEFSAMTISLE